MTIQEIVDVQIQASTHTPARQGFGVPLICGYHNEYLDLTRSYDSIEAPEADGFATDNEIHKMATALMSQSPRVPLFKVGRLNTYTHVFTLTFTETSPTVGRVVSATIGGEVASYTVQSGDTVTLVHSGLATAINALANTSLHTAVGAAGEVTVTATAGGYYLSVADTSEYLQFKDTTVAGTLAADLSAIYAYDADWYGLITDSRSEARIALDASFAETNLKFYMAQTSDAIVGTSSSTDVASDMLAAARKRTMVLWTKDTDNYIAAGLMGTSLPRDPGTYTFVFKELSGVTVDTPSATMRGYFRDKYVTWYERIAGANVTQGGKVSSGGFADNLLSTDWLTAEIETAVYTLLINSPKVPFTDAGIRQVSDMVKGVLQRAEDLVILANEPKFTVTSPKALEIPTVDRAARTLNKIEFTGRLAGAIHKVIVRGTLTI